MKVSSILLSDPASGQLHDLAAQFPEPLGGAFADGMPALSGTPQAGQCGHVLAILEQLGCDDETLAATLRYAAWAAQAGDQAPVWSSQLQASQLRLLEGQYAAEQVWVLHAKRASGSGIEGLRRLLLAIIGDLRVVFILLAQHLARLRAASQLPENERRALAQLSADIHAPLANRLGIWQLKWELEDIAFSYLQPGMYRRIAQLLDERRADREAFIAHCIKDIRCELDKAGIQADLAGRPKHIYSIWRKMQRKGLEFSDLYDIRAVRVLVDDVPACYAALGMVHALWSYLPGEFDDYIARPKGNDYKSLHTAVLGPQGKTLEVQIRTHAMHQAAELGIAAHWRYKEGGGADSGFEAKVAWMRQLLDGRAGEDEDSDTAVLANLRTELLEDRVYLLTPRGDVFDLPAGASVLDFAYHVHTDVGHRCRGAKVNGRIVPLTHQPRTGDRIEILTGKQALPSRDWLSAQQTYLNTHRAREKARAWFRRSDLASNLAAGQALYDREIRRLGMTDIASENLPAHFKLHSRDDLLLALAVGDITPGQIARALQDSHKPVQELAAQAPSAHARPVQEPGALTIAGVGNMLTSMARCCQPLPGDHVCGFITRGRGVTIHRGDCKSLARLRLRAADRIIDVEWGKAPARAYHVDIDVRGYDRKGLQKDVTALISNSDAHIVASSSRMLDASAEVDMRFTLRVTDFGQLSNLLARLDALPNVLEARRLTDA